MNYLHKLIHKIVFLLTFLCLQGIAQVNNEHAKIVILDSAIHNWEFYNFDNLSIKNIKYNIDSVQLKSSQLNLEKGIISPITWLRTTVKLDPSMEGKSIAMSVNISGSAEIYINGQLVKSFGSFSKNYNDVKIIERQTIFYPFNTKQNYIITVRYKDFDLKTISEGNFGFEICLSENENLKNHSTLEIVSKLSIGLILGIFFLTLFFVHIVIFIYNKNENSHFIYSLFCLSASIIIISSTYSSFIKDPNLKHYIDIIRNFSICFISIIMPIMINYFFKIKIPKWYKVFLLLFIVSAFTSFIEDIKPFFFAISISIIISTIETARLIIVAILQKLKGIKIIIAGTSVLVLFISIIFSIAIFFIVKQTIMGGNLTLKMKDDFLVDLIIVFAILSMISIPVSITIFLSYQIADTNKSLANKLLEVEDLSKQTLEQEKEKQRILEHQKTHLEEQVQERTIEITEQKKIIEEKNKDIIDSINYAKRIQNAYLPPLEAFHRLFPEGFIYFQPKDIVSGDFYWFYMEGAQKGQMSDIIYFAAADCTGHGVPGAMMSVICCNAINDVVVTNEQKDTGIILDEVRKIVVRTLKSSAGEGQKDGMDIAFGKINKTTNQLWYSGANNPLWIIKQADKSIIQLKATKQPVGHFEKASPFEVQEIQLEKGDTLYAFSDGYADQFGGPKGKKFKYSQLQELFINNNHLSMPEQKLVIEKAFSDWKGDLEQVDDVCVIGIRI